MQQGHMQKSLTSWSSDETEIAACSRTSWDVSCETVMEIGVYLVLYLVSLLILVIWPDVCLVYLYIYI